MFSVSIRVPNWQYAFDRYRFLAKTPELYSNMQVNVKLYGTLSRRFPGYRPDQGLELELPEGATVKDLLALLEISSSQGAVVIAAGRILKADDKMQSGVPVQVLQSIYGG